MEKSLKDLISRLPIPGLQESKDRHLIAETISSTLKIPIKPNQIQFKDSIVTVSAPPVIKSAIQIKQDELLGALNQEGIKAVKLR